MKHRMNIRIILISVLITILGAAYIFIDYADKVLIVNIAAAVVAVVYSCVGMNRKGIIKYCKEPDVIVLSFVATVSMFSIFVNYGIKTIIMGCIVTLAISFLLFGKLKGKWIRLNVIDANAETSVVRNAIIIFIYAAISLSLLWIKFYPSGTSPDTISQWNQVHTGHYSDIHAIGHTIFLKWLLSIHDCYNIVIFVHIIMISSLYAAYSYYFSKKRVRLGLQLVLVSIFTSGFMGITPYLYPWKDTPYTFCIGMAVLLLIDFIENREKFSIIKAILLGIFTVYIGLFRLNGIVITAFVVIYMTIVLIKNKKVKQLSAMLIPVIAIYCGIHYYAYDVLKTESPINGTEMHQIGSGIIAAVSDNPTDDEIIMVSKYCDVDHLTDIHSPWHGETWAWFDDQAGTFLKRLADDKKGAIVVYAKLFLNHPIAMVKDLIYNTVSMWGHMNHYDWPMHSVYLHISDNITLLLILASVIITLWKKKIFSNRLVIFMPILLNIMSVVIATITNEQRYFLPTITLFPILITYILQTAQEDKIMKSEKIV